MINIGNGEMSKKAWIFPNQYFHFTMKYRAFLYYNYKNMVKYIYDAYEKQLSIIKSVHWNISCDITKTLAYL